MVAVLQWCRWRAGRAGRRVAGWRAVKGSAQRGWLCVQGWAAIWVLGTWSACGANHERGGRGRDGGVAKMSRLILRGWQSRSGADGGGGGGGAARRDGAPSETPHNAGGSAYVGGHYLRLGSLVCQPAENTRARTAFLSKMLAGNNNNSHPTGVRLF